MRLNKRAGIFIQNQNAIHFITFSVVGWIDLLEHRKYKDIVVDSLAYCQKEKGLVIYAYVIMSNHIHLLVKAKVGFELSGILRDFKRYTSRQLTKHLDADRNVRHAWMLRLFQEEGSRNIYNWNYQVWRNDNHPIEIWSQKFFTQKRDYIHKNPVEAGIVASPEDYIYSSAFKRLDKRLKIENP